MLHIINKYSQKRRHYHNLEHIFKMLKNLNNHYELSEVIKTKLQFAILYHDYIYDPRSETNEQDSADEFMCHLMEEKLDAKSHSIPMAQLGAAVMLMILDTIDHVPRTELSKILIDLDLWELHDGEACAKNKKLIRREYEFLTDLQFNNGRIIWIESMLNKKQIFYTDYCIANGFEAKARINLNYEYSQLQGI